MGWVVRKGRRYYYRSRWVNGRDRKEYVGAGEVGEVAAKLDAAAAARRAEARAAWRHTLEQLHELDALFDHVAREVTAYVSAVMAAAGFHRHRGEWRRKTVSTPDGPRPAPAAPPPPEMLPRSELLARAMSGDQRAMAALRPMLAEPGAVDNFGNPARRAIDAAVVVMARKDLVTREATTIKLAQLKAELAGPNPSPLEAMLVEQVVSTWLHLSNLEYEAAIENDLELARAAHFQRSMTLAQHRYFAAIRELTRCRQAQLRPVQVNIAREQVNVLNAPKG